jgi:hypothetical protein
MLFIMIVPCELYKVANNFKILPHDQLSEGVRNSSELADESDTTSVLDSTDTESDVVVCLGFLA